MLAYKSQPTSRLFFWNFFFLENCWLFFPCMKVVRRIDQKESRIYAGDNKLDFPDWNLSAFALSLFFFFLTVSFFLPVASLRAGDSSIIWWINIVHPVKSLNFKNFSPISSVVAEMVSTRNITPKCTSSLSLVGNLQRKKIGGRRRRRWKKNEDLLNTPWQWFVRLTGPWWIVSYCAINAKSPAAVFSLIHWEV